MTAFVLQGHIYSQKTAILNYIIISQFCCFYGIFHHINAASVSRRDVFQKHVQTSRCSLSLSAADAVDLGSPDELTEITEVDEGICTQACAAPSSPPTIVISGSSGGGKPGGKCLRRLTGRSSKDKDAASGAEQLSRKQATVRTMSENLELLSLKRLTLTKSGSLSLSRTASAVFSRSFEQVSSVLTSSTTANHLAEAEDGGGAYLEHLSPAHQHRQRSPTISIHVTSDLWP